jgi:MFS family permease
MGINGICVAWTTGGNNQTASIFSAKLGWSAEQTRGNNTLLNFASQLGKALGAFFGGKMIQNGRKNVYVMGNVMSIISCLMMQVVSMYTLTLGKFLNGFFVTVVHMAQIKMINETVPVYLLGTCGPIV